MAIPRLHKEASIFDEQNPISGGIDDAAKCATDYITEISGDGIWVTPEDAKPVGGQAASTTTGWHISDALELFKLGVRYIKAWLNGTVPTVRLGQDASGHADVTPSGLEVFTDASASVAKIGSTVRLGESGKSHQELDYRSMKMIDKEGNTYFLVQDLRDSSGYTPYIVEKFIVGTTAKRPTAPVQTYFVTVELAFARYGTPTSITATVAGVNVLGINRNLYSVDISVDAVPSNGALVTVKYKTNSEYAKALTFGHSDSTNETYGPYSVRIGNDCKATGPFSCAIGALSEASGLASHAEGWNAVASGPMSHAQGELVTAASQDQYVIGKFNVVDKLDTYVFIVGNGTSSARSNALALKWDGTLVLAKSLPFASGGTGMSGTSKTTTVTEIITPSQTVTITAANYAQWGKVAQLVIDFTYNAPITVPAGGNITNVEVGTLVDGKRPVYFKAAHSNGDGAGQQWYGITAAGVVTLRALEGTGSQRTVAAGTALTLSATYLLA